MDYVQLGETGLRVSRICFGSWQFGGDWGEPDADAGRAAVRRALELGVNFFDTAQAYGFGRSERLLRDALGDELGGDDVVIATKGGLRREGSGVARDASPAAIRSGVEASLRQLGVEAVDLYQVHWPDPNVPFEDTAAALRELVEEGKLRHVGLSNFDIAQMEEFSRTLPVEALQPPYHLFRREIERDVLPWCSENGVGVLVYGPLAHGLLGGHMSADTKLAADDWRSSSPLFQGKRFRRNLEAVEALRRFAAERGMSVAQLAVAWTLANPTVHSAIVGARRPDQIEGVAPAAEIRLGEDELGAIDAIMGGAEQVAGPTPEG